jgi:hypothetical protein
MALTKCNNKMECPLAEFKAVYDDIVNVTGTWQEICDVGSDDDDVAAVTS